MGEGQEGRATFHQDSGRHKHVRNKIEFLKFSSSRYGTVFCVEQKLVGYIPMWYSEYGTVPNQPDRI
jgi:hypothetical protein